MILPPLPKGLRNGRLTVIEFQRDPRRPQHPVYLCRCDCGQTAKVARANMARTHSCGCIKREMLQAKATHGMSSSPEYHTWADIKARCSRPKRREFGAYGGRGITVCLRWIDSFENFYADMGPRPSRKHSIDRIDANGNYEPNNCRWATAKEQRINQRRVTLHTFNGVTGTLKDLAKHAGISYTAVRQRIHSLKWTLDKALTKPSQRS